MEFCFQKVVATLNETLNEKEGPICRMFCDFFCECRDCFYPINRENLKLSPIKAKDCRILYYFMFWLYFEENKFIFWFLFLDLSIYINKMTYQLLHGTNAVNGPREVGFDTTELESLFKLRSDGLHIKYKLDDEWKNQYPLSSGDFDLTELSNVDKIYVVGIPNNCIIPPVPTSSLPNDFTRSNYPLESATNPSNFHLQHLNK